MASKIAVKKEERVIGGKKVSVAVVAPRRYACCDTVRAGGTRQRDASYPWISAPPIESRH